MELSECTTFSMPTPNALYCIKWTKEKFRLDNFNILKYPELYIYVFFISYCKAVWCIVKRPLTSSSWFCDRSRLLRSFSSFKVSVSMDKNRFLLKSKSWSPTTSTKVPSPKRLSSLLPSLSVVSLGSPWSDSRFKTPNKFELKSRCCRLKEWCTASGTWVRKSVRYHELFITVLFEHLYKCHSMASRARWILHLPFTHLKIQ